MRKNFFKKKLASSLALAMVVTSLAVPSTASAATAKKIVKEGGAKAPAVIYVGDKVDYGLNKKTKGNKYTWTVSNSKIATINKSGVVTPKAPGSVTIKITERNSKGKWLAAYTQKITVKLRVTSVDIGADDFSLTIGEEKDLNAVKNPAKSTDVLKYVSDNTAVATVNAKTGVVKAVGAGEATITVLAKATSSTADSSKYNRKDTVKVTVLDGIQAVKQTTTTKVELTFATDVSQKLTTDNLLVTDADGVKQVIKSISFSADGKTATVEFYVELADSVTYKVAYDKSEKTFVASKGEVAKIELEGKTVQYAKATPIAVKLLDKNGVEVTTSNLLQNNVTFDYDNIDGYVDYNNTDGRYEITTYGFPKSVSVTAVYHTYNYVDNEEVTYKATAVFNSVEEIKNTAKEIVYTVAPETEGPKWDAVKTTVPATAENYKFFIKATNDEDKDIDEKDFTLESTDTSIVTISKEGYLYPVKAGKAYIKATYGATTKLLEVTVGAESKVVNLSLDSNNIVLYYVDGKGWVDNELTVNAVAKDQYGNEVAEGSDNATPDPASSPSGSTAPFTVSGGNGKKLSIETISGAPGSKSYGNYSFKVNYKDKTTMLYVKVVKVDDATPTYINFDSTTATLDAAFTAYTSDSKGKTLNVYAYNSKGQRVEKLTSGVDFTIKRDGKTISADGVSVVTSAATVTVNALHLDKTNKVATQAATGTYQITARATGIAKPQTATIVVKNTQSVPTVKREKTSVSVNGSILNTIKDAFTTNVGKIVDAEAVVGNATVTNINDTAVSGKSALVKKVLVEREIGDYTLRQEVAVNLSVNFVD